MFPIFRCFQLSYKSEIIGDCTLSDGLFYINLHDNNYYNATHIGTKHCVMNEKASILWHRKLEHNSIDRIKRLLNDKILDGFDFTDFETYVGCIKGKKTNK